MEITNMFSQCTSLGLIRGFGHRQALREGRHPRPARRHANRTRTRARFRLEGLEGRCLLSGVSAVTEFSTSSNRNWGITTGPDGNVWFTGSNSNQIGMINPTTDAVSEFAIPTSGSGPRGITAESDGNLWFTENGASKIGMINPTTDAITEFATPTANSGPQDITAGPDGNLWFTENAAGKIGVINPTTRTISEFRIPTTNSGPWGIAAGPDGNLWFAENGANKIGMINPTTHAITEFPIPNGDDYPYEIAKGPDGNLWFTGESKSIGDINPTTHVITLFPTDNSVIELGGVTAGPDGNVWFAEVGPRNIARINPMTGAITEYPVYPPVFQPYGITMGPDGNIWVADHKPYGAVGVATLSSSELTVTQQPPASVPAGSPFGLTVTAEDSSGNPITSFNGSVTVALGNDTNWGGGATLGGTLTVNASNGVATFSGLTLLGAANYYYSLYTSGGGFGWGVPNTITVTTGAPTQLVITTEPPATVKLNGAFGLQASIEDAYGNVVTTASNTVNVAFANNPTGATLGGTLSVATSQGVATFSNLTINKVGNGYTLAVSSTGLTGATSTAINVAKKGASIVGPPLASSTAVDPVLGPLVLDSPDLWDGVGLKKRVRTM
jgi:streptogramin lyase